MAVGKTYLAVEEEGAKLTEVEETIISFQFAQGVCSFDRWLYRWTNKFLLHQQYSSAWLVGKCFHNNFAIKVNTISFILLGSKYPLNIYISSLACGKCPAVCNLFEQYCLGWICIRTRLRPVSKVNSWRDMNSNWAPTNFSSCLPAGIRDDPSSAEDANERRNRTNKQITLNL